MYAICCWLRVESIAAMPPVCFPSCLLVAYDSTWQKIIHVLVFIKNGIGIIIWFHGSCWVVDVDVDVDVVWWRDENWQRTWDIFMMSLTPAHDRSISRFSLNCLNQLPVEGGGWSVLYMWAQVQTQWCCFLMPFFCTEFHPQMEEFLHGNLPSVDTLLRRSRLACSLFLYVHMVLYCTRPASAQRTQPSHK